MSQKQYDWYKVAEGPEDLFPGKNGIAVVDLKGKRVCITRYQDGWYAFAYKCPHAGGVMAEGYIDPLGNVVCPLHRYKFSLRNGRNTSGEGYYLSTWPVELREGGIFIGVEQQRGWW